MNSVLYLDIDGVLNGHQPHKNGFCGINPGNAEHLNHILREMPHPRLHIVISSAWRYMFLRGDMTRTGFENMLLSHGLDVKNRIAGFTESDEATMARIGLSGNSGHDIRRAQILEDVRTKAKTSNTNYANFKFAVLDDLDLRMPELIQTDGLIGLTFKDAQRVVEKLRAGCKTARPGCGNVRRNNPASRLCGREPHLEIL